MKEGACWLLQHIKGWEHYTYIEFWCFVFILNIKRGASIVSISAILTTIFCTQVEVKDYYVQYLWFCTVKINLKFFVHRFPSFTGAITPLSHSFFNTNSFFQNNYLRKLYHLIKR